MYKRDKTRINIETLSKIKEWSDITKILAPGVPVIIEHLKNAYKEQDRLKEQISQQEKDLEYLLEELFLLEEKLYKEQTKNTNYELIIH